jgi:hypothetical protein
MTTDNKWLETVAQFKGLGTAVTDHNYVRYAMRSRLNSGNACYLGVKLGNLVFHAKGRTKMDSG